MFFVTSKIYIFISFLQLLCIHLIKWTNCKENHKNTPPLSLLYSGKIIRLNVLHRSHSHHIQSLCLLKQLAHQNRRFMITQFMLHTQDDDMWLKYYIFLTDKERVKGMGGGGLIWIRCSKILAQGLFSAECCLL